jgi:hypothetical protein
MSHKLLQPGASGETSFTSASIKLMIQKGHLHEDYVCLSHRWFTDGATVATEKLSLAQYQSEIMFRDLGLVYQKTVIMLRKPRLQYIWIDSLCIVQDDPEEWQVESLAMAEIYGGAIFTLARQCEGSDPVSVRNLPVQSQLIDSGSTENVVFAREFVRCVRDGASEYHHLFPRGWTYQ